MDFLRLKIIKNGFLLCVLSEILLILFPLQAQFQQALHVSHACEALRVLQAKRR